VEELSTLPGIGRKTANVILVECFNIPGIVIDTHVKRFSYRTGLTSQTNPVKIEFELMEKLPKDEWSFFSKAAVLHGRYICKAKKPLCEKCAITDICLKIGL
jgi:endonuclease-3